jgi:hypothetical protein
MGNFVFYLHEIGQALGYVIEQLFTASKHNTLWNCIDFGQHFKIVFIFEVNQQYTEVGAAKVEGEEFSLFWKKKEIEC